MAPFITRALISVGAKLLTSSGNNDQQFASTSKNISILALAVFNGTMLTLSEN